MQATVALNNGVVANGKCRPSGVEKQCLHCDYTERAGGLPASGQPYSLFLAMGKVRYMTCLMCIVSMCIMIFHLLIRVFFADGSCINLEAGDIFIMGCGTVHGGGSYEGPVTRLFWFVETIAGYKFRTKQAQNKKVGIIELVSDGKVNPTFDSCTP
jgi:hypothetical protein